MHFTLIPLDNYNNNRKTSIGGFFAVLLSDITVLLYMQMCYTFVAYHNIIYYKKESIPMTIQEYLKSYKLITDGSFGTYYAGKHQTDEMPESANLTHPERVTDIHRSYIDAGARLIRTNTFASNTTLLSSDWNAVESNIHAAVKLAKDAVNDKDVFIAGDIGPIPEHSPRNTNIDLLAEEYYRIA